MTAIDLGKYQKIVAQVARPTLQGRLLDVVGLLLEAGDCRSSVGDLYEVRSQHSRVPVQAEVVGFRGERTLLMPLGSTQGLVVGSTLHRAGDAATAAVGPGLLGRVVDSLGRPLDGKPLSNCEARVPLEGTPVNPLLRRPVEEPMWVGVRSIDSMLTMGRGQRMGIFAGGGVGKSTLLGLMVREAAAEVAVIALIGERGREVEEFVNRTLSRAGLMRSVVIAATSSDPPLLRARGALYATAVAEYFRAQGKQVLLVMDSLTRYAMALREIGLAVGEPPATKGYTPSVFAALPRLLERAGPCEGSGSITGIYTVLVEGDDMSDPIADSVRAILDGHILLSRKLADRGHFPAVDIPASLSRVMPQLVSRDQMALAHRVRELMAAYAEVEDLLAIGAYKGGTVPLFDEAILAMPALTRVFCQGSDEPVTLGTAHRELAAALSAPAETMEGS
ncbi:MAG: FliI/YscN family ATPase [Myxococcales bacterium]|nr:FliI/YscN family ATPase [Myxococcales bacterium]